MTTSLLLLSIFVVNSSNLELKFLISRLSLYILFEMTHSRNWSLYITIGRKKFFEVPLWDIILSCMANRTAIWLAYSFSTCYALQISLLDRQELQQRVKLYCISRGSPEHWLHSVVFKRNDLQKALGNHLSWKDR